MMVTVTPGLQAPATVPVILPFGSGQLQVKLTTVVLLGQQDSKEMVWGGLIEQFDPDLLAVTVYVPGQGRMQLAAVEVSK